MRAAASGVGFPHRDGSGWPGDVPYRRAGLRQRVTHLSLRGMNITFSIATHGPGLTEFTRDVAQWLRGQGDGVLTLFVRHTSCSLLIQENADPEVLSDLQAFFHRLVPPSSNPSMSYLRHTYEGPDDMPAHIKAAMMPVSLTIPVAAGKMALGTWQGIYLFEHRNAPHTRQVAAHFSG